ncbi:hypothetical protein L6452_20834 [Arctium lappa]|uniref:Uncharacterized protein n=1 Tax=Arctium lappa TaxID=4217 RepID=A0ACB9BED7_ARCLA|nr:hypothetical protein L6452_20834 [Arctium lappa]
MEERNRVRRSNRIKIKRSSYVSNNADDPIDIDSVGEGECTPEQTSGFCSSKLNTGHPVMQPNKKDEYHLVERPTRCLETLMRVIEDIMSIE